MIQSAETPVDRGNLRIGSNFANSQDPATAASAVRPPAQDQTGRLQLTC